MTADKIDDTFDPSQPLADRKRERFCTELMAGTPLYSAYEVAGFARPRGNANRMEREQKVMARLAYLRDEVERFEPVLLAFRRNGMRRWLENMRDLDRRGLFTIDADGRMQIKSPADLTPEQAGLIENIESTRYGLKLHLPSKLQAAAQLAKLDGLDKPDKVAMTDPEGTGMPLIELRFVTPATASAP
jgi:hypothetical protein